jgi:D-amino-acid oxidase
MASRRFQCRESKYIPSPPPRPKQINPANHSIPSRQQIDSYEFWDKPPDYDIWYAPHVESFRQLSAEQKPIAAVNKRAGPSAPQIDCGAYYKAMSINVPRYLLYLQEKALSLNVEIIKTLLPVHGEFSSALQEGGTLSQQSGRPKPVCFVNATGLGAAKLCGDEAMYPIRGQTVLVKGEASCTITRVGDGYRAYSIPRPGSGMTILGGTKEEGVWDETPDDEVTKQILKHNAWMVPELLTGSDGGFEVISVQCGLRPARRGGPRMEKEVVEGRAVVHAYGHAGAGYQNSVGSAREVVRMVGESVVARGVEAKL